MFRHIGDGLAGDLEFPVRIDIGILRPKSRRHIPVAIHGDVVRIEIVDVERPIGTIFEQQIPLHVGMRRIEGIFDRHFRIAHTVVEDNRIAVRRALAVEHGVRHLILRPLDCQLARRICHEFFSLHRVRFRLRQIGTGRNMSLRPFDTAAGKRDSL